MKLPMNLGNLERLELTAADTKKEFHYSKDTGMWAWCDRNCIPNPEDYTFRTRLDALMDATEPYTQEDGLT